MKKIEAIIRMTRLSQVKDALVELDIHGLTCTQVKGFGRQHGHTEVYRGNTVTINFVEKVKVEIVVSDEKVDAVIKEIMKSAYTGEVGDGKIFISPIENAYRIRTQEEGNEAL